MITLTRWSRLAWALVLTALIATPAIAADTKTSGTKSRATETRSAPVDLNSATAEELQALPGVGKATAKKIIDNRPHTRKDELLDKKIVSKSTYDKISDQIVAHPGSANESKSSTSASRSTDGAARSTDRTGGTSTARSIDRSDVSSLEGHRRSQRLAAADGE